MARTAQEIYDSVATYVGDWATKDLIPNIKNLSNTLGGINALVSSVVNGVVYAVKIVTNTLLGFIVAIYLLVSKTQMIGRAKQLSYSIFSIKVANDILVRCRYIHKVFGGFIRGKLLDSFIIGIICFVGTSLLNIPFAILISVVVGVTNIIPFFGPLIGAIPCAILVLFYSPIKCIYFVIFVFALQQFDGNILGPKILGTAPAFPPSASFSPSSSSAASSASWGCSSVSHCSPSSPLSSVVWCRDGCPRKKCPSTRRTTRIWQRSARSRMDSPMKR